MEVLISNRQNQQRINVSLFKEVAEYALKEENAKLGCELSVSFVTENEIASLNTRYRGISKPTDILSFSLDEPAKEPNPVLGDIVICPQEAEKTADSLGHSLEREISLLLVHGILHLLGHSHKEDKKAAAMKKKEQQILSSFEGNVNPIR